MLGQGVRKGGSPKGAVEWSAGSGSGARNKALIGNFAGVFPGKLVGRKRRRTAAVRSLLSPRQGFSFAGTGLKSISRRITPTQGGVYRELMASMFP